VRPECPVCLAASAEESFSKDGYRHFDCRACRALFLFPPPSREQLDRYYVAHAERTCSSQCWEREAQDYRHYEAIWGAALADIERLSGRGPLLDVGCGGGQFLAFARSRGWDELMGIEVSPPAAARARERSGAIVHECDFASAGLEPERFAGVAMWNVIEHAPRPRDFVREVARLLRPGGACVADCPNRFGVTLRAIGPRAYVVMPPEHVTYFSHTALRMLLEAEGLRVRRLGSNTVYLNDWLRFFGGPQEEARARKRHLAWYGRVTGSRLALGAIGAANALLDLARLGDQLLVTAQKPDR